MSVVATTTVLAPVNERGLAAQSVPRAGLRLRLDELAVVVGALGS